MLEWLLPALPIIADNVLGYGLDQSGIGEKIKEKLGRDATKEALERALTATFDHFKVKYPNLVDENFMRTSFQDRKAGPILRQLLLRDGHLDPDALATLWADMRYPNAPEQHANSLNSFKPIARDFFDYLNAALKTEPALREIFNDIAFEQTASNMARTAAGVEGIAPDVKAIRSLMEGNRDLVQARRDYLHWLIERNLYLDPRGTFQTQRQVQVKLEDVYVSLKAQRDEKGSAADRSQRDKELKELELRSTSGAIRAEEIEDQRDLIAARLSKRGLLAASERSGEVLELSSAVSKHNRLVILGDPGSGKTTLLRYLALKHAQAMQSSAAEASSELGKAQFPIFVRIADYAEHGKGKSLSEFLADYCGIYECPKKGLAKLLAAELQSGNCLVLLDGLDEIVSADERITVVRQIEEFVRHHAKAANRFVITSRVAGYDTARLSGDFAHYKVQEMDDKQIRRFLEVWCPAVEFAQTPDLSEEARAMTAKREITAITDAVQRNPGVRRLAANPLLLRTLALIHRTGAQLPQKRIELYKLAADTLARTWRIAQGVKESALVDESYLTRLLGKLAYWLHVNKPTGIATEQEVYRELGQEWARIKGLTWDEDNADIEREVRKFLLQVREHTGLFVERAPRRYGFMHLTFEEYYVARYLVARSRTRAELIRKHLHEPRWEEPILLALGFVGMDSPDDASELIEIAILAQGEGAEELGFTPSKYEDLLGRDYLFALRCLGDQIPTSVAIMQQLMDRLKNELLHQSGSAQYQRYRQALDERLEHLKGSKAAAMLIPQLVAALKDTAADVRIQAAVSLGRLATASPEVLDALLDVQAKDAAADVRIQAAVSLGRLATASPEVLTTLLQALARDADAAVRRQAAVSLGQLATVIPEVLTTLLHVLVQDGNTDVRSQVARSLGQLATTSFDARAALLHVLARDADAHVRSQVARSLGQLATATPEVLTALLQALVQDDNATVRYRAAESLGQLATATPEVLTTLLQALARDADANVRYQAAVSLGRLATATPEVLTTLLQALARDADANVRRQAAVSLGQLATATPGVLTALLQALVQDGNALVRTQAAWSLGQLATATPGVLTALLQALTQDVDTTVRYRAARSLWQLGQMSNEVILMLFEILSEAENWPTRRDTVRLLGRLGKGDEQTIQALYNGLLDDDNDVRTACAEGLALLGQRFPELETRIEELLMKAITQRKFDKRDRVANRTAHDYAFAGLWLLVVGGEIEEE